MQLDLLNIILIIYGLYTLYGVLAKPDFYWQGRRMQRIRGVMGDDKAKTLYLVTGIIMLGVGLFGMLR